MLKCMASLGGTTGEPYPSRRRRGRTCTKQLRMACRVACRACYAKNHWNPGCSWVLEWFVLALKCSMSLDYVFRGSTGASIKMFSNTGGFRIWAEAFFEDPTSNWVPEFQKDCERKYFSQDGISWRIRNVFEAVCNLEPFGNLKPFFAVKTSVSMA